MGHSSIVVTMNTYGHLLPRLLEEVTDRLEASLFPRGRQTVDEGPGTIRDAGQKAFKEMVPGDGVEPQTRGFSVPYRLPSRWPLIQATSRNLAGTLSG